MAALICTITIGSSYIGEANAQDEGPFMFNDDEF
jgi:hypothetical protein